MSRVVKDSAAPNPSNLIARMAAGDDRALGALYDAYGRVAYALALTITGAPATAESVLADAFGEAWRSASSFDSSRASVLAWLMAIVRHKALRVRTDQRDVTTFEADVAVGSVPGPDVGAALSGAAVFEDHVVTRA